MIESKKKKILRTYAPLSVLVSVKCTTTASPPTQVFDALGQEGSEFAPDRSLFPTVLEPEVCASASDGSWPEGNANSRLANVKWFSNGIDISLDPAWTGLYTLHTADDGRKGSLEIMRNVGVGDVVQLTMEAELIDFRTGKALKIATEPVTLSTTARSDDMYSLDMADDQMLYYDPVADKLALDDYNKAHGLKSLGVSERSAVASDRSSYLRSVPLRLMQGPVELKESADFRYRVYRVSPDGSITELGGGFDEIVEIPAIGGNLRIDMRLVDDACYLIRALHVSGDSEREVARRQFHARRVEPDLSLESLNRASMSDSDRMRMDVATVKCGESVVRQPDRLMRIKWLSQTQSGLRVSHNCGAVGHISLSRAGVVTPDNKGISEDLQIWCEAELRDAYRFVKVNGRYARIGGKPVIMN